VLKGIWGKQYKSIEEDLKIFGDGAFSQVHSLPQTGEEQNMTAKIFEKL